MATIAAIRDALKTRLSTISGLEVYDTVPGQVNTPAAVIHRRSGPRIATAGSANHDYTFAITVLTSMADDKAAQDKMDDFLSTGGLSSIEAALESDEDLTGQVAYAVIIDVEGDRLVEYAGVLYLGADIVVDVGT